jgi:hypothetical protein
MESNAVTTTNGAGPHNVQLFMLSEDGTVLHCLPGYWDPNDLQPELDLAQKLNSIWLDRSITGQQKAQAFKKLQLEHLAGHSKETIARSHLQGFDAHYIAAHAAQLPDLIEQPDMLKGCYARGGSGGGGPEKGMSMHAPAEAFKTTDKIMHQRMCKYPFVAYDNFDTASYINYGTHYYDKNESEASGMHRPDLKRLNLHRVTRDAPGAPPSVAHARKAKRSPSDPAKKFYELADQNKLAEAFECADKLVFANPSDPLGYEVRAIAAYRLGRYDQAYSDATRAAWLGCRQASNAEIRRQAKGRIGPKGQGAPGANRCSGNVASR